MHPQTINWIQLRYIETGDINIVEKRCESTKIFIEQRINLVSKNLRLIIVDQWHNQYLFSWGNVLNIDRL